MTAGIGIKDAYSDNRARVTEYGQLIVAPLGYSTPVEQEMSVINTAYNFLTPAVGQKIVITDIIVAADKGVSATTPANVVIYQADAPDTLTESSVILRPQPAKGDNIPITGLNLLVPEGMWVNAKTDDATVFLTILYYRIPI
jgi:hypothetical protein